MASADQDLNLYRHPKAQGPTRERFCRAYDVYALGIVLLEIGFWRRIAEFWRAGCTPEAFQHTLCDFYVPKLGGKVGRVYMDVVRRCLEGKLVDDEADAQDNSLEAEENPFTGIRSRALASGGLEVGFGTPRIITRMGLFSSIA